MFNEKSYRDFCLDQVNRMGVINPEAFRWLPDATIREFADWLASKAFRKDCDQDAMEYTAKAFMTSVVDSAEKIPTFVDLKAHWNAMFPPPAPRVASDDCENCHGTGWELDNGAKRCRCGGLPPGNSFRQRDDDEIPDRHAFDPTPGTEVARIIGALVGAKSL